MERKEMLERLRRGEDPLEVAIQKWHDIVYDNGEDHGTDNCALCEANSMHCDNCIIYKSTGEESCVETPQPLYGVALENHDYEGARKLALDELEFLKSLRGLQSKDVL